MCIANIAGNESKQGFLSLQNAPRTFAYQWMVIVSFLWVFSGVTFAHNYLGQHSGLSCRTVSPPAVHISLPNHAYNALDIKHWYLKPPRQVCWGSQLDHHPNSSR